MKLNSKFTAGLLAGTLMVSTLLTGCGGKINTGATLVNIGGGETVTLGYYNFAARYQQSVYDVYYAGTFGDSMWEQNFGGSNDETFEDSIKKSVLDGIEESYLCRQHAADYGVELTDELKASISEAADKFLEENSKKAIDTMGATKEYIEEYLTNQFYYTKVRAAIRDNFEVNVSDDEANQSKISYVLVSTAATTDEETGEQVEKTEDEIAKLRADAESISTAESLEVGAEAHELTIQTYTYTAAGDPAEDTTLGADVITAAKALGEGEVSSPIEVEGKGFYVVRLDSRFDADATMAKRAELEDNQRSEEYNSVIDGWKEETEWTVNEDLLKKVKFNPMFEMSKSMQDEMNAQTESESAEEAE